MKKEGYSVMAKWLSVTRSTILVKPVSGEATTVKSNNMDPKYCIPTLGTQKGVLAVDSLLLQCIRWMLKAKRREV